MLRNLQVAIVILSMLAFAEAGTVSIGTASARGDLRVDSYMVKGNATLFNGSVIETGQASADLRLSKGTEITMSASSRGTLYGDHLVLQQGESELATSSQFQLDAKGLRVTANQPNSRVVVSMRPGNTVEVAALTGSFGVTNDHGALLASVHPGIPVSFAMQAGSDSSSITVTGTVSFEDGHFFLTVADTGAKYELTGKDLKKVIGKTITVSGPVVSGATLPAGVTSEIDVSNSKVAGAGLLSTQGWIITGVAVGAGVGIGVGVYAANQSSTPASR